MKKQFWLLFLIIGLISLNSYAQLSDLHYLPPLKQGSNNSSVQQQRIYLSTPETSPFTVNAYVGTSTVAIPFTISNVSPAIYNPGNGDNGITMVPSSETGIVLSTAGLRFEAPGGQKFYVNYRGSSNAQSTSLTAKGRQAMGTRFKWGGVPNYATTNDISTSLGIMATEDNTTVDIFGYDPNCEFRLGNDRDGIIDNTIQIVLNEGESFVLEAYTNETTANIDGWLGASITSNKNVVISNGGLNYGVVPSSTGSRDAGIDQPVPEDNLGKDYVFIRGGGTNATEFPIIIATQNNTQIFVNGATTPMATINQGDYFIVPGSNYSSTNAGANMYVRTSKDAYAYQNLAGSSGVQTIGLNFVAPINCLLPDTLDNIPDITDAAGTTLNGGITIVAASATPDANIIVTDGSGTVTKPASLPVTGNPDWKTFYINGLTGNVNVKSSGPIAVGFFGANGNRGIAGYFSGFDTEPNVDLQITGTQCLPGANLEVIGEIFDAYQWYFDGNQIVGATASTHTPTQAGDYFVRVTKGPCSYDSNNLQAYYCNPDIELKKTANTTTINEGETVTFSITVQNFGVDPVTNLAVTDILPNGLSLVSATPSTGLWNSPYWTVGTLTSGTLESIDLIAIADSNDFTTAVQTLTNTASNTQDQSDSNITVDSPSVTITILNDFDNDGIMDVSDLDDDNDGILDTIECGPGKNVLTATNLSFFSNTSNAEGVPGSTFAENGSTYQGQSEILLHFPEVISIGTEVRVYIGADPSVTDTDMQVQRSDMSGANSGFLADGNNTIPGAIRELSFIVSGSPLEYIKVIGYQVGARVYGANYGVSDGCADTDLDGIPNSYDLDSDNDGCFDALEGDALESQIGYPELNPDGSITGSVDGSGIPNTALGGQDMGTSQNGTLQATECSPCDINNPLYTDNDGDLVGDFCDLDDDNDGILDTDEGCAFESENYSISGGNEALITLNNGADGIVFDVLRMDNSFNLTINGSQLTSNEIEFHAPIRTVQFTDGTFYGDGNIGNVWSLTWNTPANADTPLIRLIVNPNGTVEIFGSKTLNGPLQPMVFVNGLTINPVSWNADANNFIVDQFINGSTFLSGSVSSQITRCTLDTDGDGRTDNVDIDADDDGCNDVLEASYTDVDGNGEIDGSGFNTDGTVAGSDGYAIPVDADSNGIYDFQEMGTAPSISVEPANQKVLIPDNATFELTETNTDNYQWQVSVDDGVTFTNVNDGPEYSGSQTNALTVITPNQSKNGYIYRVLLFNNTYACGQAISQQALLNLGPRTVITNRRITFRVKNF